MTAAPITFILALALVTVGIFTSDALTFIGEVAVVITGTALILGRNTRSNA